MLRQQDSFICPICGDKAECHECCQRIFEMDDNHDYDGEANHNYYQDVI